MTQPIRLELPTGLNIGSVNAYLFTEPEPVLVDAGIKTEACWQALEDGLAQQGLTPTDLSRIVITHPHVDHFGLAGRLLAESSADLWVSDLGRPWLLETSERWQQRLLYYRDEFLVAVGYPPERIEQIVQGMWGIWQKADPVPEARMVAFAPDGVVQMGGLAWQSIHVPGHTYAQTAFYQRETRQLISADHLLRVAPTPVVERPYHGGPRHPALPQFLQSLKRMEALAIDCVYPGHGRPFSDHHHFIDKQRQRIDRRKADALALVAQGHHTLYDLLPPMYAHHPPGARFTGLWMLVGYLDLLLDEGAIRCETVDGVWHYTTTPTGRPQD